jgi:hypothetical protein
MLFARVNADPFFSGGVSPHKRYVRSCVVVFLFRVYNLKKERRARDDEKDDAKRVFFSVGILQIERKVDDDARESENREEEKHIARKIESFGGDGFVVVIIIIFF